MIRLGDHLPLEIGWTGYVIAEAASPSEGTSSTSPSPILAPSFTFSPTLGTRISPSCGREASAATSASAFAFTALSPGFSVSVVPSTIGGDVPAGTGFTLLGIWSSRANASVCGLVYQDAITSNFVSRNGSTNAIHNEKKSLTRLMLMVPFRTSDGPWSCTPELLHLADFLQSGI